MFSHISSRNKSFLIIILSKNDLRQFAITDDINLYITFSIEIGRQFFKKCRGLFGFGIHVIMPWFCVTERDPFLYA